MHLDHKKNFKAILRIEDFIKIGIKCVGGWEEKPLQELNSSKTMVMDGWM